MLSLFSWILIATQLFSLHRISSGCVAGWILGAAVQGGWLIYGVATGQYAFVVGCVVSLVVHARGCCRALGLSTPILAMTSDK